MIGPTRLRRFLPALCWLALCACGEEQATAPLPPAPPVSSPPPNTDVPSPPSTLPPEACDAGDRAFVQRATLALWGRRPLGQAELEAYTAAIAELRSSQLAAALPDTARQLVAQAMMRDGAFRLRWSDFFKDSLRVARTEAKSQEPCYGDHESVVADGGALARFVRDSDASASDPSFRDFTMRELLASALELDDLSVLYRAHLFAMMSKPLVGNALELELELARRNDFGATFEATYTRRNIGCLPCHNSEFSVTANADPAANHFWPVPGLFERALFGASSGRHQPEEVATKGSDLLRARGMFRYMDVVVEQAVVDEQAGDDEQGDDEALDAERGVPPFGWSQACGTFQVPTTADPLHIDTWFGNLRSLPEDPSRGQRMSVWDLERSLKSGFQALASGGLPSGEVAPDQAFATLVALNIVENVWTEVMGTSLTIGHHFPRTAVQRDLLVALTDHFMRAQYSLKALLSMIVEQDVFNLKPPSAGCGGGPYPFDRLLDPWTDAEADPLMRGNGPSDGVFPLSPRVLRRSLHTALEWPMYPEYPEPGSSEETLSLAVGFFLRDGEPGRRGLDFQGRLAWEAAYGSCRALSSEDFIYKLALAAEADPSATVFDAVVALKDRLIGEPYVSDAERAPLEALLELPLDDRSSPSLDGSLRRLCGVLVSSPMFMLGGMVPDAPQEIPKLTPPEASEAAVCLTLRNALAELEPGTTVACPE